MGLIPRQSLSYYSNTGAYINGIWVKNILPSPISFKASIQPLRAREMEMLPEGRRNGCSYRLYSSTFLNTVEQNGSNPSLVDIEDELYEVYSRASWANGIIPHYKYIIIKLPVEEVIPEPEPEPNLGPILDYYYTYLFCQQENLC
jgi:hypothetical protein